MLLTTLVAAALLQDSLPAYDGRANRTPSMCRGSMRAQISMATSTTPCGAERRGSPASHSISRWMGVRPTSLLKFWSGTHRMRSTSESGRARSTATSCARRTPTETTSTARIRSRSSSIPTTHARSRSSSASILTAFSRTERGARSSREAPEVLKQPAADFETSIRSKAA